MTENAPEVDLIAIADERITSAGDRALTGYYIGFDSTGEQSVDRVLSMVARAGKAYHSTEYWSDDVDNPWGLTDGDPDAGYSWNDLIQAAGTAAATELADARAVAEWAINIIQEMPAGITEHDPPDAVLRFIGWSADEIDEWHA